MGEYIRNSVMVVLLTVVGSMLGGCGSDSTTNTNGNASVFYATSLAFRNNSTVGWGYNGFGQLGDGTTTTHTDPQPRALVGVKGVALGGFHSLAFGTYTTWSSGGNSFGQLGRTLATNVTQDVGFNIVNFSNLSAAKRPRKIIDVAAGGTHNLLVDESGRVWAWGAGGSGQLGNNVYVNSTFPVQVVIDPALTPLTDIKNVAAGGSHSLALSSLGVVFAWGYNGFGQLGFNTITIPSSSYAFPVAFPSGTPLIADIFAAGSYSMAVDSLGYLWGWGYNGRGQIGSNPLTNAAVNVPFKNFSSVKSVATGLAHVVVLRNDRSVWTWGFNGFGQLGDGGKTDRYTPSVVSGLSVLGNVDEVRAFGNQSFARIGTKWYSWGDNSQGQLGYATTGLTFSMLPLPVPGL